jgi:hypothetical protein
MLKFVLPDLGRLENHREWLYQCAIVVDYLYADERLEYLTKMQSEPIFHLRYSQSKFLNIGRDGLFAQPSLHLPPLIIFQLPRIHFIYRLKTAIELAPQLDIVPGRKHKFLQVQEIANLRGQP